MPGTHDGAGSTDKSMPHQLHNIHIWLKRMSISKAQLNPLFPVDCSFAIRVLRRVNFESDDVFFYRLAIQENVLLNHLLTTTIIKGMIAFQVAERQFVCAILKFSAGPGFAGNG
jgi:hypothetical protein